MYVLYWIHRKIKYKKVSEHDSFAIMTMLEKFYFVT